jgi:hypothetical protein
VKRYRSEKKAGPDGSWTHSRISLEPLNPAFKPLVLLLRSDIHTLFDQGYVTVTPDQHFEVSRRLKEDWSNGREYYALHGRRIRVPRRAEAKPGEAYLQWHAENVFRG